MAKVNIENIVEHLDSELRNALKETVKEHFPKINFDERALFRTFVRMVGRKCSTWENVPDRDVEL